VPIAPLTLDFAAWPMDNAMRLALMVAVDQ
jgi:hypothetical protein